MVNTGYFSYSKSLPTTNMHGYYVPSTKDNKGTEIQRHFSFLPLGEYVWFTHPATLCKEPGGSPVARLLATNFGEVFRLMWLVAAAPSMSNRLYFSPSHRRHIGYWLAISTRLSSIISRGCPDGYCGGKETSNCTGSASSSSWVANGGEGGGQGNFWTWSSFLWCPRKRVSSCLWKTQFPQQNKTFWLKSWFIFDQWMDFPEIDCCKKKLIFAS